MKRTILKKWIFRALITLCAMMIGFPLRSEGVILEAIEDSFEYQGVKYEILNKFVDPITLQVSGVDNTLTRELILPEEIEITIQNPINGRTTTGVIIRIREGAFENSSLEKLVMPSTVTGIGSSAFSRSNINEVTLPEGLLNIGAYAFRFTHLESIEIPESTVLLDYGCFMGNYYDLKKVTLPSTLRVLCGNVFTHCSAIQDVFCYAAEPPIAHDSDFAVGKWGETDYDIPYGPDLWSCKLHVPESSIHLYQEAEGWKNFQNIVAIDDSQVTVEENLASDENISFTIENGLLSVKAAPGDSIAIYDLSGVCLKQVTYSEESFFKYSAQGIYILTVNGKNTKIVL